MINFSRLQSMTIPEGNVKEIAINGSVIWRKDCITLNDIVYKISDNSVSVLSCPNKQIEKIEIKSEIDGLPVTSISIGAFGRCSQATNVSMPNTIQYIGHYAFDNCTSLSSIIIPDSVIRIDDSAFSNCSNLTSITIPNNVTFIGSSVFKGCNNLKSIIFNDVSDWSAHVYAGEPDDYYMIDVTNPEYNVIIFTDTHKDSYYFIKS